MKKFNLKEHNAKVFEFSKNAARGVYPSKRVAKAGSVIGFVIGIGLVLIGMAGSLWAVYGDWKLDCGCYYCDFQYVKSEAYKMRKRV